MPKTAPINAIVIHGDPFVEEYKVESGTNMYAGRLVVAGTHADDINVCGAAGKPIGWLGYEQATKDYQPLTVDTLYAANDLAPVLFGGHFVINASIASGSTSEEGGLGVPAAAGQVSLVAALSATVPTGATTVTATSAAPACTIAGSFPAGGMIVCIFRTGGTAGSADVAALSLI